MQDHVKTAPQIQQNIHSTVPVICTADVQASLDYYTSVLGFSRDFEFGDPVVYAGVRSGEAEIYFTYDPAFIESLSGKEVHPEVFIWISDAQRLFEEHKKKGAEVIEPIIDRPWGARQYVIREINGYHLKFAQPL